MWSDITEIDHLIELGLKSTNACSSQADEARTCLMILFEWNAKGRPDALKDDYLAMLGNSYEFTGYSGRRLIDVYISYSDLSALAYKMTDADNSNGMEVQWIPYCLKGLKDITGVKEAILDFTMKWANSEPHMINYVLDEYFWDEPSSIFVEKLKEIERAQIS